jgi:hypothetical protein
MLTHTPEHWPLTGDTGTENTGVEAEAEWVKMMISVTEEKSRVRKKAMMILIVMMMMRRRRSRSRRKEKQEKKNQKQVMHAHYSTRVKDAGAFKSNPCAVAGTTGSKQWYE